MGCPFCLRIAIGIRNGATSCACLAPRMTPVPATPLHERAAHADPDPGPLITIPLIGWMMYRGVRRQFGRQPFQPKGWMLRLALLGVVTVGLIAVAVSVPGFALPIAVCLVVGSILAAVKLRLTRFEWTEAGDFYHPHPYIGAALSLLLVGRIVYRYTVIGGMSPDGSHPLPFAQQSPLTYGLFGLLVGYLAYAIGLLIVRSRHHGGASR